MILKRTLAVIFTAAFITASASAASTEWYTEVKKDHTRPAAPAEAENLEEYSGYYLGKDEKKIFLTFDAGYSNESVEKIIDILIKENIPAAFFVLSHFVEERPDLVTRMAQNGILICNHTSSHKSGESIRKFSDFCDEVQGLEVLCEKKTGVKMSKYFRPPCGKFDEDTLRNAQKLGYKTIFWSVAYVDWEADNQPMEASAMNILCERLHNGAIILLHPVSSTNAAIMEDFISYAREEGYSFASLDEL